MYGNKGSCDVKLQVMLAARFSVSEVLSMCYISDISLLEDESSCDKGEEIHAYQGPRVRAPKEVGALNRVVTSESIVSFCSSAYVGSLFVSADVSTDAEEDQRQFLSEWYQLKEAASRAWQYTKVSDLVLYMPCPPVHRHECRHFEKYHKHTSALPFFVCKHAQ